MLREPLKFHAIPPIQLVTFSCIALIFIKESLGIRLMLLALSFGKEEIGL
jgi:hypothetical protein